MIADVSFRSFFALVSVLVAASFLLATSAVGGASRRDVTVPVRARETDLADAFAMLRSLGLRVAIDRSTAYSSLTPDWVARVTPRVGTRVAVGTVVTITPSDHGPIGSPSVLKSHPRYRVPSFIGKTAATAMSWANSHHMFWSIPRLPVLPASHAQTPFAAYRVTSQTPRPGKMIVQGIMIGQGFKPTPLTLALQP
jgi:beta-lactam-binding protein with PASTA domain